MDCIPSALVRTDWSALAAWTAAAANVAVVWAAFRVQRKQAEESEKLVEGQHLIAAANGIRAISNAILSLKKARHIAVFDQTQSAFITDELQRRSRVMNFFTDNPMADYRTLELLIEVQADVSWMLGFISTYAVDDDDDGVLNTPPPPLAELNARSDRWDLIQAEIIEKGKAFAAAAV